MPRAKVGTIKREKRPPLPEEDYYFFDATSESFTMDSEWFGGYSATEMIQKFPEGDDTNLGKTRRYVEDAVVLTQKYIKGYLTWKPYPTSNPSVLLVIISKSQRFNKNVIEWLYKKLNSKRFLSRAYRHNGEVRTFAASFETRALNRSLRTSSECIDLIKKEAMEAKKAKQRAKQNESSSDEEYEDRSSLTEANIKRFLTVTEDMAAFFVPGITLRAKGTDETPSEKSYDFDETDSSFFDSSSSMSVSSSCSISDSDISSVLSSCSISDTSDLSQKG